MEPWHSDENIGLADGLTEALFGARQANMPRQEDRHGLVEDGDFLHQEEEDQEFLTEELKTKATSHVRIEKLFDEENPESHKELELSNRLFTTEESHCLLPEMGSDATGPYQWSTMSEEKSFTPVYEAADYPRNGEPSREEVESNKAPITDTLISQVEFEGPVHETVCNARVSNEDSSTSKEEPHSKLNSGDPQHDEDNFEDMLVAAHEEEEEKEEDVDHLGPWFAVDEHKLAACEMMRFCLLVSPTPTSLTALVSARNGQFLFDRSFQKLELPKRSELFMGTYTCWQLLIPKFSGQVHVSATFPGSGILHKLKSSIFGKNLVEVEHYFYVQKEVLQIEFLHGRDSEDHVLHMAFFTFLVLLNSPLAMTPCLAAYQQFISRAWLSLKDTSLMLIKSLPWFEWIRKKLKMGLTQAGWEMQWVCKMILAFIIQTQFLRHVQHRRGLQMRQSKQPNIHKEEGFQDLMKKQYEALLSLFSEIYQVIGSLEELPVFVRAEFANAASDLVDFTPAVKWSSCLDALCRADPSYRFINKWINKQKHKNGLKNSSLDSNSEAHSDAVSGRKETLQAEKDYDAALSRVLKFANDHPDKVFKEKAIRVAILAAPSALTLLKSIGILSANNLVSKTATFKEVEVFLSSEYGKMLINVFEWLTELETAEKMAVLLLQALSNITSESMVAVLRFFMSNFVQNQLARTIYRDSKEYRWMYLKDVFASPRIFCVPLLNSEILTINALVQGGPLELAVHVMLKLSKQMDGIPEHDEQRVVLIASLSGWLQQICARSMTIVEQLESQTTVPITPLKLYSFLTKLFGEGLKAEGYLANALSDIIPLFLKRSCAAETIVKDAAIMSTFQSEVMAVQYHSLARDVMLKHLMSNDEITILDSKAEQLLGWLLLPPNNHTKSSPVNEGISMEGWIQRELCNTLLDALLEKGYKSSLSCESLVDSRFLLILLQIKHLSGKVKEHALYHSASRAWTELQEQLQCGSLRVEVIEKLLKYPNVSWERICREQNVEHQGFKAAINLVSEYLNIRLKGFYMLLYYARHFEGRRCSGEVLENWTTWMEKRDQECRRFTLNKIMECDHWPMELSAPYLSVLLVLKDSKILENIFKDKDTHLPIHFGGSTTILEAADPSILKHSLWSKVNSLLQASVNQYREEWRNLSKQDYPVDRLNILLNGLNQELMRLEANMAVAYFDIIQAPMGSDVWSIELLLESWMKFVESKALKDPLLKLKNLLNLLEDEGLVLQNLLSLQTIEVCNTLGDFQEMYKEKELVINFFSSEEVEVLKQLAESEDLIRFLRDNTDEDLRILIDAIEEQAEDAVIDEVTISDLIHIDKLLRPILQSNKVTIVNLKAAIAKEANESTVASGLSGKLKYCTENIHRIRQFVASLADRSSVLKSHMFEIMESGSHTFILASQSTDTSSDVCNYVVSCGGTQGSSLKQQFNLTDLKDLRSRARMLLSTRRFKYDLLENQIHVSNSTEGRRPNMKEALMEFVEHVNLAEKLLELLRDLQMSGHLLFDKAKWNIRGLRCLQERVEWMDGQLACWHAVLQRSRKQYNYLNFFTGIELRLIYHCFITRESLDQLQICWELLEWAKPGIEKKALESQLKKLRLNKIEANFSQFNRAIDERYLEDCLNSLGTAINSIFASVASKEQKKIQRQISPVQATSTLNQDAVRLVSVDDQQRELNVVIEIFHKHHDGDLRKMATNLLLCSSATRLEEIDLMILRFLASDNEPDIFVIAYIDKLTFECQSQLTERLQKLSATNLGQFSSHQLILICCTKAQALHGISHHLKVPIQSMDGPETKNMILQLPEKCKEMRVVTSALSGMGKTRFIKVQKDGYCATLPINREVTRDYLILKLKAMSDSFVHSLHLDIISEKDNDDLNVLLFELLVCGSLKSSHVGVFRLQTTKVFVELANTLGNLLETSLFVCSWLPQEHLEFDINDWKISKNLDSDDQVVCVYLDKLATNELDKQDIVFSGMEMNVVPLLESRCRELVQKFFIKDSSQMSYTILVGFIKTFAYQLRQFDANTLCKCETLRWILRDSNTGNFRSISVESLLQAARDLSLRSVQPWLHEEQKQIAMQDINKNMHERTRTMLRWSQSNHVMIFFDANGLMRILYRDHKLIPPGIKQILSIQVKVLHVKLQDYLILSSEELWNILWPVLGADSGVLIPNYILTPDNVLKMALVSLRIKTRVPVIIIGETGCGKTSLLRALATFSSANFCCLTLHAGSTVEEIELFINKAEAMVSAADTQVWAFLDEINACPHLGFLNSIVCHHTISGRALHPKLVVLAACNPYRLKDTKAESCGLRMKNREKRQEQELAYTVHPLPEAMLDYVWDYGNLSDSDERAYITAMIGNRRPDIVDLISSSQMFMREHLGMASVSLRDVQRWISLYDWFKKDVYTRLSMKGENKVPKFIERRAKVLACSLCYHCRFPSKDLRRHYREVCCSLLWASIPKTLSQLRFLKILHEEQVDILSRMEIPSGIAINSSLLENVFVVLVCLLNFIPVFVVGKPGSGKTLALQTIYSNLRGTDSKDEYFRKLPRILSLSYQGSLNSTSEGILKVFDKAKRYVHSNRERDVLVVVVLDEIGLAESSHYNPLKVLHPLLEPDVKEIAFVAISNWSLDAAKMNRGIHLSQSDPGIDDLYQTSLAIFDSYLSNGGLFLSDTLRRLSAAYHKYRAQQVRADFHGLRDFYSLVKSLRICSLMLSTDELAHSIWRNFGGSSSEDIKSLFTALGGPAETDDLWNRPPSVIDLVKENLQDPEARHLMLITKGDSASNILQHILQEDDNFVVIRGSTYKDDKNEEYCYLMLSDIILHMEIGRHVLLENADQIWTSLYDMLNQHYSFVGGRRNCRIALGAYSNPMCFVHDDFRCIVVVEEDQVPNMDPPFLNRFEKQKLTYETILNEPLKRVVDSIRDWAHKLASMGCTVSNVQSPESYMFAGYYEDSIPSLVMFYSSQLYGQSDILSQPGEDITMTHSQLVERCKNDLLQTAYVDAIARAHLSLEKFDMTSGMGEFRYWTQRFLSWTFLHSLSDLIEANIADTAGWKDSIGMKLIITTCTPAQWSIQQHLEGLTPTSCQCTFMRLGDFTLERQLQSHIQKFWCDEQSRLLILQADDALDKDHISLAKFHVDKSRKLYQEVAFEKHVLLIIHVQHGVARRSSFSFLCGWKQLTVHRLQKEPVAIRDYLSQSMKEIIYHEGMPIKHIMARVLAWSYLCIKYDDPSINALYPQQMVQSICEDKPLMSCIKERALVWVLSKIEKSWQVTVLNNQKLLSTSASVHDAFVQYIEERFREAVARIVYLLEKTSSLKSYFNYDAEKQYTWRQVFMLSESLKLDMVPAPCYPEGYLITRPLDLSLPFSSLYAAHVDIAFQALYLENFANNNDEDRREIASIFNDKSLKHKSIQKDVDASLTNMLSAIMACVQWDVDSYIEDFAKIHASKIAESMGVLEHFSSINACRTTESKLVVFQALEWIIRENLKVTIQHPSDLHIFFWENELELKAQVSMALICMPLQEIIKQLAALKAGRAPFQNFREELSVRCSKALLPTKTCVVEDSGIQAWLYNCQNFTSLLPPGKGSVLLFMLQSLQALAVFVILPLRKNDLYEILIHLADSFQKSLKEASCASNLREILKYMPEINKLPSKEAKCWLDFLCAVLKQYLNLTDLPKNDFSQIFSILMSSLTSSCMMGPIMLKLLTGYLSAVDNPFNKRIPQLMTLLSNTTDPLIVKQWNNNSAGSILLSDQLYHYLRQTISPALLGGMQTDLWDFSAFDECLFIAITFCEDQGQFTLQTMAALAFWKSFLYSAAHLLNQLKIETSNVKHSCKLVLPPTFMKALKNISSTLKDISQAFFMKVLYRDVGLSTGDIQELYSFCKIHKQATNFLVFLDHDLVRNADNRLGFNPFTSSSKNFVAVELAMKQALPYGDENSIKCSDQEDPENFMSKKNLRGLRKFIKEATRAEQIMFVAVMASELFVKKSGASLSKAEWAALEWLRETIKAEKWDCLLQSAVVHLFTKEKGGLWHLDKKISTKDLELWCLIIDILLKVAALPDGSPLRGYCMLNPTHFQGAHVLTDADNVLQKVEGLGRYREYVCPCGFQYIVGNCTRPMQTAKCPNCSQLIGGTDHVLLPGQLPLRSSEESGRSIDQQVLRNPQFSFRISPKSYRLLRVLVYSCLLIGAICDGDLTDLSAFMQRTDEKWSLIVALTKSIQDDMLALGKLIDCKHTMTSKYIHSMLKILPQMPSRLPLKTFELRDKWESTFEHIVDKTPVQETIIEYVKARGTDGLNNLLMEQIPCPLPLFQTYFRITKAPCLSDYETKFRQSKQRVTQHPCIAAVFAHAEEVKSLTLLMPLVRFCGSLHQALGHSITRHAATTTSIESIMQQKSELAALYDQFELSWNKIRLEVQGFECRQFTVPEMHIKQPVALCLIEKKDQGIFITGIFELLRARQNDFLQEVEKNLIASSFAQPTHPATISKLFVPVQLCKADQVVTFNDAWLNDLVSELGMCEQIYGHGISVLYDDSQIEHQVLLKLVQGKPLLQGEYVEFPYQQESFQRHATLISDVRELVAQEELPPEKIANIKRELTLGALGAGQMLASLELCLGFLRKTKADPSEPLRDYCTRWLDNESHPFFAGAVFDGVEVKHVVSFYEGLEESASLSVEELVTSRYRSKLDDETRQDLKRCVMAKKSECDAARAGTSRQPKLGAVSETRQDLKRYVMAKTSECGVARAGTSGQPKLGAEAFRDVLRKFMFRYLTADTFKPEEELSFYLTNPDLVTWPEWDVDQDTLDDIFPSSFKLKHSRALYIALKKMCQPSQTYGPGITS